MKTSTPRSLVALLVFLGAASVASGDISVGKFTLQLPEPYILDSDANHNGLHFAFDATVRANERVGSTFQLRYELSLTDPSRRGAVVGTAESTVNHQVRLIRNIDVSETLKLTPSEWLDWQKGYEATLVVSLAEGNIAQKFREVQRVTLSNLKVFDATGAIHFGEVPASLTSLASTPVQPPNTKTWSIEIGTGSANGEPLPNANLSVSNEAGVLTVTDGEVLLGALGDIDYAGWNLSLDELVLSKDGAAAKSFGVHLPPCIGRLETETGLLDPWIYSTAPLALAADFTPLNEASGALGAPVSIVSEELPLIFRASQWAFRGDTFVLTNPTVAFARKAFFDQWLAVKGELPNTNDAFWYHVSPSIDGDVVLHNDANPGLDVRLSILPEPVIMHFPLAMIEHQGGTVQIARSQIVNGSESALENYRAYIGFGRGCRHPLAPHTMPDPLAAMSVEGDTLYINARGGLYASGEVTDAPDPDPSVPVLTEIHMGRNGDGETVHATESFLGQQAAFYTPGGIVPHEDPHVHVNSSVVAEADYASYEYPSIYHHTEGSVYAGANVSHFDGLDGTSRVGGDVLGPFPMTEHTELYIRASGVTGIFGADEQYLPQVLNIGDFELTIDDWEFSALSNQQHESDIEGNLRVPYPADFSVPFDELYMNCCGNVEDLVLPPGAHTRQLRYWTLSEIEIKNIEFVSADECTTEDPALRVAVEANVNGLTDDRPGVLHILGEDGLTNGQHANYPASFLELDPNTDLAGGYQAMPVRHAFYNDYLSHTPGDEGHINLVVENKAAFFDPIKVHARTNGFNFGTDSELLANQQVFMQGGWKVDGKTYFSHEDFDSAHVGWPKGNSGMASPMDYFNSESQSYTPRAERRVWFTTFGFPIKYDPITASFTATEDKGADLIVVSANANLPRLTQDKTEITFGAGFNLNVSNVLEKLVAAGVEAATREIFEQLDLGFDAIDDLLETKLCAMIEAELSAAIEAHISNDLLAELQSLEVPNIDDLIDTHVLDRLPDVDLASNIIGKVNSRFNQIANAIQRVEEFLSVSSHISNFAGGTLDSIPCGDEAKQQISQEVTGAIDSLGDQFGVSDFGQRLAALRDRVIEIGDYVETMQEEFNNAVGFALEIENAINNGIDQIHIYANDIKDALRPFLTQVAEDLETFQSYSEVNFRAELAVRLSDQLCATAFVGQVQSAIRARVRLALAYALQQVVSTAFQQVGLYIADTTADAVVNCSGIGTALDSVAGYATSFIEAGKFWGHAVINREELELLRLDGEMVIHTEPVAIRLHPFFEFRSLTSDGSKGCNPALIPSKQKEVLVGAKVSPAIVAEENNNITASAKFSFAEPVGENHPEVIGFMGKLEIFGGGSFAQPLRFDYLSAMFSVSGDGSGTFENFEMYLAAEAEATMNANPINFVPYSNYKLRGGFFAGQTCSSDPLHWAPYSSTETPLRGVVAFAEGSFPFYDFGCLLQVKAKAGMEFFFFSNEDYPEFPGILGSTIEGEVSGEVLCLLSAKGSVSMSAGTSFSGDAFLNGEACLKAKVGICPVCKKFDDCISVQFSQGGGFEADF